MLDIGMFPVIQIVRNREYSTYPLLQCLLSYLLVQSLLRAVGIRGEHLLDMKCSMLMLMLSPFALVD